MLYCSVSRSLAGAQRGCRTVCEGRLRQGSTNRTNRVPEDVAGAVAFPASDAIQPMQFALQLCSPVSSLIYGLVRSCLPAGREVNSNSWYRSRSRPSHIELTERCR